MKILIVSQRYWPENFRITDIAEELVKRGNSVTVLTGLPNYPKGYIFDEYKHGENRIQEHNGVKIIRAKEIERRNDIFHRFLNYYSFPKYANRLINKIDKDFDVVLVNELSPIMGCLPALKYKKKYGTKVVMYEMDLWPESLLAGGIKKDSLIYNYYKKVSARIYSKCDKILVSTKEHINYIKALPKCEKLDVDYLPQYAESIFSDIPMKQYNKDQEHFDFMFAGNIGKAQNCSIIIEAANVLKDNKNITFHIVGDGSEKANIEKMALNYKLDNVVFYGSRPLSEMPKLYESMDAMIVTLEDSPYANMTIPGKVQSYLAAGKPILCCANGASYNYVKECNCGLAFLPNNVQDFACAIEKICNIELLPLYSKRAKETYLYFKKEVFFDKLISILNYYYEICE